MKEHARKQIEELYKIGVDIREAESKKPGYSDGIKNVLTGLYPDNAHFIFELFQNAEDKGATHVDFQLTSNGLVFIHNGSELFEYCNVSSITNIGDSTKLGDDTKIGKFGVGFKAVFAYTDTPRIFSGDYWFEIRDLICPYPLDQSISNFDETRFEFPFNNKKKSAHQAVTEISKGLQSLGDNTLLFLRNIKKIEYTLSEGLVGSLERIDHGDDRIEIRTSHPDGSETVSYWLRFQKDVVISDEDNKQTSCRIAIAYNIVDEADKKKVEATSWRIVPLDHGQVSIYFPATGEKSNLRFHIHAPFASNVARTNIRDCEANKCLRDHLAELVVESVSTICDQGMLTIGFLAVLPNLSDNLAGGSPFYEPIRKAVVKTFQEKPVTPMKKGGHCAANHIYRGPASLSNTVDDNDLVFLLDKDCKHPLWVSNPPPQCRREKDFLDSLEIKEWGWDELKILLRFNSNRKMVLWIQSKDDNWLKSFYLFLHEAIRTKNLPESYLKESSIVRIASGELKKGNECYFPIEGDKNNRYFFVKRELLEHKDEARIKEIQIFLETLGVKSLGEQEELEALLLDEYSSEMLNIKKQAHISHINKLIAYWKKHSEKLIAVIKVHKVFLDNNSESTLWAPYHLYIDKPFMDTGLRNLFNDEKIKLENRKQEIWNGYAEINDFTPFAIAMGVMSEIEISHHDATAMQSDKFNKIGIRTGSTEDNDYFINGSTWHRKSSPYFLGDISLNSKNTALSNVIWKTLCRIEPYKFEAYYLPNKSNRTLAKRSSSFFINQLRTANWIPDRDGKFLRPANVTKETIHPDFMHDDWNKNGCLTAIGFGENEVKQRAEYKQDAQVLSKYNLTPDIAKELGKFSPDEQKELLNNMLQKKHITTPTVEPLSYSPAPDPDRRRLKAQIEAEIADEKQFELRSRSVRTSQHPDVKSYLKGLHINENSNVICQICDSTMPFKIDSVDYFEAVQFVRAAEKEIKSNHLALCPTCAAAYKHACGTSESKRVELLLNLNCLQPEDELVVPLILPVECNGIRFTQKHLIDLQEAMKEHLKSS